MSKLHCLWVDSARPPRRGHPPGSTASFINQGHCTTRYTRLSNLAARLKHNYVGPAAERGDRDVGVQQGEYGVGVGGEVSFFFLFLLYPFHIVGVMQG